MLHEGRKREGPGRQHLIFPSSREVGAGADELVDKQNLPNVKTPVGVRRCDVVPEEALQPRPWAMKGVRC